MQIDIRPIIKREVYCQLEQYVKDNKTGLLYLYLIMNTDTRNILCEKDNDSFYGINIAIDNNLELCKVMVVKIKELDTCKNI